MKNITKLLVVLLAFFAVAGTSFAIDNHDLKKAEIKSTAFTFEQKLKLENLIWEMEGVEDAKYDTKTKTLSVKYNSDKLTTDMMIFSITNKLGYSANLVSDIKASECKDSKSDNVNAMQ